MVPGIGGIRDASCPMSVHVRFMTRVMRSLSDITELPNAIFFSSSVHLMRGGRNILGGCGTHFHKGT